MERRVSEIPGMKWCYKCDAEYPVELFSCDSSRWDNLNHICKVCQSKKNGQWNSSNPLRKKEYRSLARYKLTYVEHQAYLNTHQNKCDVCGSTERLCIDHDHSCCTSHETCGKCLRGVLCAPCNSALGYMKDDIRNIERLVRYVKGELDV